MGQKHRCFLLFGTFLYKLTFWAKMNFIWNWRLWSLTSVLSYMRNFKILALNSTYLTCFVLFGNFLVRISNLSNIYSHVKLKILAPKSVTFYNINLDLRTLSTTWYEFSNIPPQVIFRDFRLKSLKKSFLTLTFSKKLCHFVPFSTF